MLAKRGSRDLAIGGVKYRWTARKKRGTLLVAVQDVQANGQLLVATVGEDRHDMGDVELVQDPITPSFVMEIIKWGLANGWKPKSAGQTFEIDCYKKGLMPS